MSYSLLRFILVSFCIVTTLFLGAYQLAWKPYTKHLARVQTSFLVGRTFFAQSVINSLKQVKASDKPTQVDLYILIHYLMYEAELGLAPVVQELSHQGNTQENKQKNKDTQTRDAILDYLTNSYQSDVWRTEGCMSVKFLSGLSLQGISAKNIDPLAQTYRQFIHSQWGDKGIGECFSSNIVRTYGEFTPPCSDVTLELMAKMAYLKTITTRASQETNDRPLKALASIQLPGLNDTPQTAISSWFGALPELWIIRTWQVQQEMGASQKDTFQIEERRYQDARKRIRVAYDDALNSLSSQEAIYASVVLYTKLLSHNSIDRHDVEYLSQLLTLQQHDGRFPSSFNEIRYKGHNIDATPSYFALLALQQYQNKLKTLQGFIAHTQFQLRSL
jgi:hypothetical protein